MGRPGGRRRATGQVPKHPPKPGYCRKPAAVRAAPAAIGGKDWPMHSSKHASGAGTCGGGQRGLRESGQPPARVSTRHSSSFGAEVRGRAAPGRVTSCRCGLTGVCSFFGAPGRAGEGPNDRWPVQQPSRVHVREASGLLRTAATAQEARGPKCRIPGEGALGAGVQCRCMLAGLQGCKGGAQRRAPGAEAEGDARGCRGHAGGENAGGGARVL